MNFLNITCNLRNMKDVLNDMVGTVRALLRKRKRSRNGSERYFRIIKSDVLLLVTRAAKMERKKKQVEKRKWQKKQTNTKNLSNQGRLCLFT